MRRRPEDRRKLIALVLAAALIAAVAVVGVTSGFGGPEVPEGQVAFVEGVEDGGVTQEQYDAALEQAAARQGINRTPEPGTPQHDLLKEAAMSDLLLAKWVAGEARDLGIEITDREIEEQRETIVQQQFGGEKQFQRFLEQQNFSEEDALERIELQLVADRVQERVVPAELEVPGEDVEEYYESNQEQFTTPENRDVRTILNPDREKAQQALDRLEQDDAPGSWKKVAEQLSTDEATSGSGGLRQAVVEGQNEPALDEAIFAAPEGELQGPLETPSGFYVFQVTNVNAEDTQELDDRTREQIVQTLRSQRQQQLAQSFQTDFLAKWRARTVCADDYVIERCGNAPERPDACTGDDDGEELPADPESQETPELGCPAFVPSIRPVEPGSAGDPTAQGRPQGPVAGAPPPTQGALPIGLPGAPTPPGAAPPGAVPPPPG